MKAKIVRNKLHIELPKKEACDNTYIINGQLMLQILVPAIMLDKWECRVIDNFKHASLLCYGCGWDSITKTQPHCARCGYDN